MPYDLSNPQEGLYFRRWVDRTWRTSRVGGFVHRRTPKFGEAANAAVWLVVCLVNIDLAGRNGHPLRNHPFWSMFELLWVWFMLVWAKRLFMAMRGAIRRSRAP